MKIYLLIILFVVLLFIYFNTGHTKRSRRGHRGEHVGEVEGSKPNGNESSTTCSYLKSLGYFDSYSGTEALCLQYTQSCGEPSNAALAYNNLLSTNGPGRAPPGGAYATQILYENANPSNPENRCEEALECNPGCPNGFPFTCRSFNPPPGQTSPACY